MTNQDIRVWCQEEMRTKVKEAWDRINAVGRLLAANGCDCECDHDAESHEVDCDRCLACRIALAIETENLLNPPGGES